MSIYNENPESSIANPFFSIHGRLAFQKQTFHSEWDIERKCKKAENTIDAFLTEKNKIYI